MAAQPVSRLVAALFRIDPTTGFVEYVQTVKPYHTKILEVLVEYVWTDVISGNVCDILHTDMTFTRPDVPTVYDCGYGIVFDAPAGFSHFAFSVKGVVTGLGGSWTLAGDHTALFTVGMKFIIGKNIGGGNGFYTVAAPPVLSSGNTVLTVVETIPAGSTPLGIAYRIDTSKNQIINADPVTNSFLVTGHLIEKFFEGVYIQVDNTFASHNDGAYIIQAAFIEGANTRVYVKNQVLFATPFPNVTDGWMFLHSEGFSDPPYCRLSEASDLHADGYVSEYISFEFTIALTDEPAIGAIIENEVQGFGSGYGSGPFGSGDEGFAPTAPTTAIILLPTGLDGQWVDEGGMDEDLQILPNFYNRTI